LSSAASTIFEKNFLLVDFFVGLYFTFAIFCINLQQSPKNQQKPPHQNKGKQKPVHPVLSYQTKIYKKPTKQPKLNQL